MFKRSLVRGLSENTIISRMQIHVSFHQNTFILDLLEKNILRIKQLLDDLFDETLYSFI